MGIKRHIRYSSVRNRNSVKEWAGKLSGVPAFILGNSPSLNDENLSLLDPYFTIGINRAFYKTDPTVLFWQDIELWFTEKKKILKLNSVKVCRDMSDPQSRFFHYRIKPGNFKVPKTPNILHGFGTTGPLAVQFAYALGCDPIILLGMDCHKRGTSTDFYGRNRHHKPHTLKNCSKGLKWIRDNITDRTVISCSQDSDIFEYQSLEKVIQDIGPSFAQNRGYWAGRLSC